MYLLDTNTLIYFFTAQGKVALHLAQQHASTIKLPAIAVFELTYGNARSNRPDVQRAQMETVLNVYEVLAFDLACARIAGPLRASLEAIGTPIGQCDLFIASTALANDMTVVTRNVREFARVPGLRVEDWYG